MSEYDGHQYVGIDLHRRRSVIVRQTADGMQLSAVRILNDPVALGLQIEKAGIRPDVVLEATYGWYWAVDALQAAGAEVHMAHPLGVKGFAYRRVKNDIRDASDLADLLRMGRLPESWIAPPEVRELRELVRYRAKLVALRSGLKAQVHAVLAKAGILIAVSDLFGVEGRSRLEQTPLSGPYAQRVTSLCTWLTSSTPRRPSSTSASPTGCAGTPAAGPSGGCPASARCWPRCSLRRSATSTGLPPLRNCAPGPG
ncbi:IS110 family transposase [Streptomyces sp. CA-106131]|uniref:IS110 family transposase n=1 Tax=Streptomyces sp. CA-106131 TaxID=3240045 RepID=UPI003D9114B4